jgi:hypothetical protein
MFQNISFANSLVATQIIDVDTSQYIITGNVYDSSTKRGLAVVTIVVNIKNKPRYFVTDSNGSFKLKLPLEYQHKNFSLTEYSVSYHEKNIKIKNKKHAIDNTTLVFYLSAVAIDFGIE